MSLNYYMIKEVELYYPNMYKRAIHIIPNEKMHGLDIVMDDGRMMFYDGCFKLLRYLPDRKHMSDDDYASEFMHRLNHFMRFKGISQEALSDMTGISQAQISNYTSGRQKPSFTNVCKIAKALGCELGDLTY